MASNAAPTHIAVYTPRPTKEQIALHQQLLASLSSADSNNPDAAEAILSASPLNIRQRSYVQFAQPNATLTNGVNDRIMVDEVDHGAKAMPKENGTRSARSRSRSILRSVAGPRSASRPARRRALSRGRPISRYTTFDQPDDPAMTPEEIARELRPESFTRFKRITDAESLEQTHSGKGFPIPGLESTDFDFDKEAKAMRKKFEQMHSPASLSPREGTDPTDLNTNDFQEVKLMGTEAFDNTTPHEHKEKEG